MMRNIAGALLCAMAYACGSSAAPEEPSAYLLALVTLPASDAAPDNYVSYALNLGPSAATKVFDGAAHVSGVESLQARQLPHAERWAARMAYEQTRHAQARAVADVTPPTTLMPNVRGRLATRRAACTLSSSCDTGQMCWHGQCTSNPALNFLDGSPLPSALTEVITTPGGVGINVLLDSNVTQTPALLGALHDAVTAFGSTFDQELQILGQVGHTGAVDRDGDGRFTVAFTNATSVQVPSDPAALTGFFSVNDFLPSKTSVGGATSDGNEADILWVRIPNPTSPQKALIAGTIAHEYAHMTSYALRVWSAAQSGGAGLGQEDLWLDEATAHLMEDLTGWGSANVRVAEQALENWNRSGVLAGGIDSLVQRGEGYLLLRYLVDQAAKKAGAKDAAANATTAAAAQFVGPLLREDKLGWQHAAFAQLGPEGVGHWLQALQVTGLASANASGVHVYDYLPVGTSSVTQLAVGMNPRATFVDADGLDVDLRGPETALLSAGAQSVTGDVLQSGSVLYTVDDFDARQVTLAETADPTVGPFLYAIATEAATK